MKTRLGILMKYPLGSAAVVAFLVVLLMMGWRRVWQPWPSWVAGEPSRCWCGCFRTSPMARIPCSFCLR